MQEINGSPIVLFNVTADSLIERLDNIEQSIERSTDADQCQEIMRKLDDAIDGASFIGNNVLARLQLLRFRAEEKLGRFLLTRPKAPAGRPKIIGSTSEPIKKQQSLADLGIDKKLSSRAQQIANLPEEVKEKVYAGEIKPNAALKQAKPEKVKPPKAIHTEPDEVTRLRTENEELRERLEEMAQNLEETTADNEMLAKAFESDDRVKAALAEAKKWRTQCQQLEARIAGLQGEKNAAVKKVKASDARVAKLEKELAKAKGAK